jgi:hypothetical protein
VICDIKVFLIGNILLELYNYNGIELGAKQFFKVFMMYKPIFVWRMFKHIEWELYVCICYIL